MRQHSAPPLPPVNPSQRSPTEEPLVPARRSVVSGVQVLRWANSDEALHAAEYDLTQTSSCKALAIFQLPDQRTADGTITLQSQVPTARCSTKVPAPATTAAVIARYRQTAALYPPTAPGHSPAPIRLRQRPLVGSSTTSKRQLHFKVAVSAKSPE